ncbi:MerR family transcriptional regulator [Nocardiopsis sp. NRRL B-16309]|uniref:MerR family transcriptional regulator n=1 Tax=Nocardiopsis sp. NRRL B-16309 TaxID=1519494 RepID=UPI0006ADF531|nr:MerR family transcriptional regulator [Nocardiopsis sp. NRRL B-16309]KOX22101.1 MerR family transcriptional regulator [Nocardiopsis sp. NRRL B-16309]
MSDALTPGAAARLLGVAPATLRSWDRRYGIGPRERSPGGHRRYGPGDLARLRTLCRLVGEGLPPAEAARQALDTASGSVHEDAADANVGPAPADQDLPVGAGPAALQGVARAAMRLDADLVESLLEERLRESGVVGAWEELAQPLLYGMGRKWEATRTYVEVEHLLSWCVSSALRRVAAGPVDGSTRVRPVLLACTPREMHGLPVEALAAALREAGSPYRVLGPCTPVEATLRALRRLGPRALVLWSHAPKQADAAVLAAAARAAADAPVDTAVFTAGPGWREGGATRFAHGHLGSLRDAVAALLR